jgi:hypothetical protein
MCCAGWCMRSKPGCTFCNTASSGSGPRNSWFVRRSGICVDVGPARGSGYYYHRLTARPAVRSRSLVMPSSSLGSIQSSGSGVFAPFLKVHASPQEDGHNTDGTFLNDEEGGGKTHSVAKSDLRNFAVINNALYLEFALDLGEPSGGDKSQVSLDQLKVCSGTTKTLSKADDCPTAAGYSLDAGADRSVLLDYDLFKGGNGKAICLSPTHSGHIRGMWPLFCLGQTYFQGPAPNSQSPAFVLKNGPEMNSMWASPLR